MKKKYAIIFKSVRKNSDDESYQEALAKMLKLVELQSGYLGYDSVNSTDGRSITISYWENIESVKSWKSNEEHLKIQKYGKENWYKSFEISICEILSESFFDSKS